MLQGEHSAIIMTFIKLPFFIKIFFEWPFITVFTVKADEWHATGLIVFADIL